MKIMDLDVGRDETIITVKDTDIGITKKKTYYDANHKRLLEELFLLFHKLDIDELHIETSGYGIVAYDYFSNFNNMKEKVKPFKRIAF